MMQLVLIATKLKAGYGLETLFLRCGDEVHVKISLRSCLWGIMDNVIEMKIYLPNANDTLGSTERTYIAKQVNACRLTLMVLLSSASFNGVALLPTADSTKSFQVGESTTDTMSIHYGRTVNVLALFGADDTALAVDTDGVGADVATEINVE